MKWCKFVLKIAGNPKEVIITSKLCLHLSFKKIIVDKIFLEFLEADSASVFMVVIIIRSNTKQIFNNSMTRKL